MLTAFFSRFSGNNDKYLDWKNQVYTDDEIDNLVGKLEDFIAEEHNIEVVTQTLIGIINYEDTDRFNFGNEEAKEDMPIITRLDETDFEKQTRENFSDVPKIFRPPQQLIDLAKNHLEHIADTFDSVEEHNKKQAVDQREAQHRWNQMAIELYKQLRPDDGTSIQFNMNWGAMNTFEAIKRSSRSEWIIPKDTPTEIDSDDFYIFCTTIDLRMSLMNVIKKEYLKDDLANLLTTRPKTFKEIAEELRRSIQ